MPQPKNQGGRSDERFLPRDPVDGSSRVRIRFKRDVVSLIEEAAGDDSPIRWIEDAVEKQARADVQERRRRRNLPPGKTT